MFDIEPLTFVRGGDPERMLEVVRQDMSWRPTAVALVRYRNLYCVSRHITYGRKRKKKPPKVKIKPDLPKGGVDPGETVQKALYRELFEEIRLSRRHVRTVRYLGYSLMPFDKNNHGRDGYKKGKLYFVYEVVVHRPTVAPGRDHRVIALTWRPDPWNHFRQKNGKTIQKRRLLMQPNLRTALRGDIRKKW